jgi:hypothetical protein
MREAPMNAVEKQELAARAALAGAHLSPAPGSLEERARFAELQRRLAPLFRRAFPDRLSPQTIVVLPSMTLDGAELRKLTGAPHYEERLLCMLMLLRRPRNRVVYLTSQPIPESLVDYYLHLLPGIPFSHARRRLTLLSCHDGSAAPLTEKVLRRPLLLERIRAAIPEPRMAHVTCFNATALERTLAVQLGVPLYACDPALADLGSKSGGREVFRRAGVALPDGFERLRDARDVAGALAALRRADPGLRRAVVKLEEGFSGEGNAVFDFGGAPAGEGLERWVRETLPARLRFEAAEETWESYAGKLAEMGGVTECWVDGAEARSPSVQCRIDPLGRSTVISTHDQVLGGPTGQVFQGCTFPADPAYTPQIQDAALRVSETLAGEGALGRFGVDFVSVRRGGGWESLAIEINLRKGGTTHPYLMLQYLTDGVYDPESGLYRTPAGRLCCYHATDNLRDPAYAGLTPDDLIELAVTRELHFHAASQQGVVFHMIGALSEHGKLGAVCIGESPAAAARLHADTVATLDREARRQRRRPASAPAPRRAPLRRRARTLRPSAPA